MQRRFSLIAMGSVVDIALIDAPEDSEEWAAARLAELERAWSRFDPSSELVRLNERASGLAVPSSELLRLAVQSALRLWQATDGWFDPTTLAALEHAGYRRTFSELRDGDTCALVDSDLPTPGVPTPVDVIVDDERGTITVPHGVRLDLGGVGKGLAADLLARELVARGAAAACVSVGGDVAVAGVAPDGGWVIPVTSPLVPDEVHWQVPLASGGPLSSGGIAQSSRLVRTWVNNGVTQHHLIDPFTASPSRSAIVGVTVIAEQAWWAEGVAKAALLAGPVAGALLIDRLALGGWMVRSDGSVIVAGSTKVVRAA